MSYWKLYVNMLLFRSEEWRQKLQERRWKYAHILAGVFLADSAMIHGGLCTAVRVKNDKRRKTEVEMWAVHHNVMDKWILWGAAGVKSIEDPGVWRINTTYTNMYDILGMLRHSKMVGAGSWRMYKQTVITAVCRDQSFHFRQQKPSPEATHWKKDRWVIGGSWLDKYLRKK